MIGQSISKMAGLVVCSRYALVSTYQRGPRQDNQWTGDGVTGTRGSLKRDIDIIKFPISFTIMENNAEGKMACLSIHNKMTSKMTHVE